MYILEKEFLPKLNLSMSLPSVFVLGAIRYYDEVDVTCFNSYRFKLAFLWWDERKYQIYL